MSNDRVDLSGMLAMHKRAYEEMDRVPDIMLDIVQGRAAVERRTHKFHNITGLLEKNTRGQQVGGDQDPVTVELVMNRPYASHVQKRGRTDIEKRRDEAAARIQARFERGVERVAGK